MCHELKNECWLLLPEVTGAPSQLELSVKELSVTHTHLFLWASSHEDGRLRDCNLKAFYWCEISQLNI